MGREIPGARLLWEMAASPTTVLSTEPGARSAVLTSPSKILAEVICIVEAIVGLGKSPVRSPPAAPEMGREIPGARLLWADGGFTDDGAVYRTGSKVFGKFTSPSPISRLLISPSRILAEVIASLAMVGLGKSPVRSPPAAPEMGREIPGARLLWAMAASPTTVLSTEPLSKVF